jgi:hypothetical protein
MDTLLEIFGTFTTVSHPGNGHLISPPYEIVMVLEVKTHNFYFVLATILPVSMFPVGAPPLTVGLVLYNTPYLNST